MMMIKETAYWDDHGSRSVQNLPTIPDYYYLTIMCRLRFRLRKNVDMSLVVVQGRRKVNFVVFDSGDDPSIDSFSHLFDNDCSGSALVKSLKISHPSSNKDDY